MDSHSASASSLQNNLPTMNPAEVSNMQAAFAYQSEMLKGYQEQLTKLQSVNEHLIINNNLLHLYSAFLDTQSALHSKGAISSSTTNVQHPPG